MGMVISVEPTVILKLRLKAVGVPVGEIAWEAFVYVVVDAREIVSPRASWVTVMS